MANEIITSDGEVLPGLPEGYEGGNQSLAIALSKAEVDQQITTARAFPRSVSKAVSNITALATLDEETAEECIYALPRGGKPIKGPSVRLAEIIQTQWGNNRVGARVVHVDRIEKYVEAEGVYHDLETNSAVTARVRRSIEDKYGKIFKPDMILVTGNAASSIAKRNAILGGVPKAVWRKAYAAAEQVIAGDLKTLSERKEKVFKAFAAFGVTPEQLFAALDIGGADDITLEHMTTLTGMRSALKSGEETVETMFPKAPAGPTGDGKVKGTANALDQVAAGGKAANAAKITSGKDLPKKDRAAEGQPDKAPANGQAAASEGVEGAAPRQGQQDGEVADDGASPSDPSDVDGETQDSGEADAGEADEGDTAEELQQLLGEIGESPKGIDAEDVTQVYAFRQGMMAAEKGVARKAIPGSLRAEERKIEAAAWQLGHDLASERKRQAKGA